MVGVEPAQLAFAVADLAVELVDQAQAGLDRRVPRLRQVESGQELAAAEVGDRAGLSVGKQHRVHALLEAGAVTHEVEAPARTLALGTDERVRQSDRRHQVPPPELGQHPGVRGDHVFREEERGEVERS
jgi:hypothetical protein